MSGEGQGWQACSAEARDGSKARIRCVCACVRMAACVYGCVRVWLCACMAACMAVRAWLCVHGCVRAWLCACMAVCVYGCVRAWVCVHGCVRVWLHTNMCVCMCVRILVRVCADSGTHSALWRDKKPIGIPSHRELASHLRLFLCQAVVELDEPLDFRVLQKKSEGDNEIREKNEDLKGSTLKQTIRLICTDSPDTFCFVVVLTSSRATSSEAIFAR